MMPKRKWWDSKIRTNVHNVINSLLKTQRRKYQNKISKRFCKISQISMLKMAVHEINVTTN
ncbi:MAG: hypothetical protein WD717_08900 [Nitrosarchaeum sp.]